ncbi:formate dehydrogenase subunit gamma [Consotaella salsifontis]|uniref:Formate dehydrogenase subunit gamma n=1 Tax=Consotaella salsifontis TaxID=1365950 RepID=A0A1T4SUN0_9HYPH|nr:formate dehydrogenase subunit gamma [Consotaella salsifontis]SKA31985.1 formate dehydrogenase subunit gamma [Consotaella salsifontis]
MASSSDIQRGDAIHPGDPVIVSRYTTPKRINHWITATSLILLALSGLALFHPSLFFLTGLFGGGQNTRWIHPWIGVVLFVSFYIFFFQLWRANIPRKVDFVWAAHAKDFLAGNEDKLPELGKYNLGQKVVFWAMAALIVVSIVTGVIMWDQYFATATAIPTKRIAILIHSIAAVLMICVFIVHVYAAIWARGTLRAMTRGTVTGGWAWKHHRKWLRDLAGHGRIDPAE